MGERLWRAYSITENFDPHSALECPSNGVCVCVREPNGRERSPAFQFRSAMVTGEQLSGKIIPVLVVERAGISGLFPFCVVVGPPPPA